MVTKLSERKLRERGAIEAAQSERGISGLLHKVSDSALFKMMGNKVKLTKKDKGT